MNETTSLETTLRTVITDTVREVVRQEIRSAFQELMPSPLPMDRLTTENGDRYLSLKSAAEILEVSERTIKSWVRKGDLPAYMTGRAWRLRESELHSFIRRQSMRRTESEDAVDRCVNTIYASSASECRVCGHLPKMHHPHRGCVVRNCSCRKWEPM